MKTTKRKVLLIRLDVKNFLLKCWNKLAIFFKWVERHPLIDRCVLLVVKIIVYIITRK